MFNFCDVIHLGYLKEQAARASSWNHAGHGHLDPGSEELLYDVIRLSSCHPNLIQYLCQQFILEANARHSRQVRLLISKRCATRAAFKSTF